MVVANQTPLWDPATAGVMEGSGCLLYDLSLRRDVYMTSKYCILSTCIDTHTYCTILHIHMYL